MPFLVFAFHGYHAACWCRCWSLCLWALLFGHLEDTAIQFTATLINIAILSVGGGRLWRMIRRRS